MPSGEPHAREGWLHAAGAQSSELCSGYVFKAPGYDCEKLVPKGVMTGRTLGAAALEHRRGVYHTRGVKGSTIFPGPHELNGFSF